MKIYIRHMVSQRCKIIVMQELKKIGLNYVNVDLGVVNLPKDITREQKNQFNLALQGTGLELIEDKKDVVVEQIKTAVIELIYYSGNKLKVPFSTYLSNRLKLNYNYLSNMFTESEGITIAHFIIMHKIECVKEFIQYDELSFSEIAFRLHYSSIAHLSNQFKKITGTTLSYYKAHGLKRTVNIENL
ncbi:AraC family transcriptional regulator [Parabacteroides sp. Marseille-P3160]|uniref:helix-turn-helix domain-containing protein n=1 Tax=Parabacteroides sp. Marseille-P3160 TaxID=1917887 RepID=UPI0009BC4D40|nr:AraC family transcriptional regulator [Parabacteroides sp. Marseille-P3160]